VKVRTVPVAAPPVTRISRRTAPDLHGGGTRLLLDGADRPVQWGGVARVSADAVEVGLDFRAGVAWQFLPNWKVFSEYRFTTYSISPSRTVSGQRTKVEADLDTNHVLFGIGYSFR